MPKPTFFNLPEEKRMLIIDTCLETFACNAYDKASLSKIVVKAGIAKGSMYQYFDDKEELYAYLIDFASKKKLAYINALLEANDDFFLLYKEVIFLAARFDMSNPLYSSFLYSVGKNSHNPNASKQLMGSSIAFIENLLKQAYDKGQIRQDVNLKIASFIIGYLSVDIGEYIGDQFSFSYQSVLKSGNARLPVTNDQIENVLDELIRFLKHAIAKNL
jgi:AcrR family transcriptional regulator